MFYQDKLVVVTGGTGFVGTHIVEELLKNGARIRIPIHKRQLFFKDSRIETIPADLTRLEDCQSVCKGSDYVFHAAGAVASAAISNPMSAITQNLILTSLMLQAAWTQDVKRMLLFGSSTAYPVTDHPVKEEEMWTGPTHPSYFGYGWMRRYLERMGEFVASKSKTKIALLRPTAVYGRRDNFDLSTCHVIPALIRKAVEKSDPYEVWGSGQEIRDFLHVSDLARACLLLLEKDPECDPVNIGYGQAVTIKEIVSIILKAAGHNDARVKFDASKPTTIPFRMVDTEKARRILDFQPSLTLEEGLKDTVEWYASTVKRSSS
jgi:GDP-L-fucose synthase